MKGLKEGTKYDKGKNRLELLPVSAVNEIARVFTKGAEKYEDNNWMKGIKFSRVYGALQRHITAWWDRNDTDEEWGISHLCHAGCCLLFLITYTLKYKLYRKFDDRPNYEEIVNGK